MKKIVAIVALVGVCLLGYFAWNVNRILLKPNTTFAGSQREVFIPTDASWDEVREILTPHLIDIESFEDAAEQKGYKGNLKAGRFLLPPKSGNNALIGVLRSQNAPLKVRFNNQERIEDLAGRIAAQIEADSTSLVKAMRDPDLLDEFDLKPDEALALYLPDTYEMFWNSSATDFTKKMGRNYRKFWNDKRLAKAAALNLTPAQVTTLASIVQKETAMSKEKPRVAGVYINRLRKNMALQADPTVIYNYKTTTGDWDEVIKRVLYKHTDTPGRFNTYLNPGLPAGPIAMPDLSTITAVLNYEDHNYLYFAADPSNPGYHSFATSLAQHNRNANTYRRWADRQGL